MGLPLSLISCRHCGREFTAGADRVSVAGFCCAGCQTVHNLLHDKGLDRYYRIREDNPPVCPLPVTSQDENFDWCDDAAVLEQFSNGDHLTFYLEGLQCTACLWLLEKLPELCPEAVWSRVNMANSTLEVQRRPDGSFARIAATVSRLGYRPHPIRGADTATKLRTAENRRHLIRIGVAAFATGNIMIQAVSLYGGAGGEMAGHFRWISAVLAVPVLTYSAWPFYQSTWAALRNRHLSLDVPIVLAIVAGVIASLLNLFSGGEHLYFDSLSMLVFLLLSSRYLLRRIQQHHLDASNLQDYLVLSTVSRLNPATGAYEKVSSVSLKAGDRLWIEGAGVVPADGLVRSGNGSINAAALTGESAPRRVRSGDQLEAGMRTLSGAFELEVTAAGSETRMARILKEAERTIASKPQSQLFADRVGLWFLGIVLTAAVGTVVAFGFEVGLHRALALVIVACPCVFGMAIPLSLSLSLKNAARFGAFIKDGETLERLLGIRRAFFDKTGTLTRGDLTVTDWRLSSSANSMDQVRAETDILSAGYALEAEDTHPVAVALRRFFASRGISPAQLDGPVERLAKGGVYARMGGSLYEFRPLARTTASSGAISTAEPEAASELKGRYGLFRDSTLVAEFELEDEIRPEAKPVVERLRSLGIQTHLLSGDRHGVVQACAQHLGLPDSQIHAEVTPETKTETMHRSGDGTMMVGDGVNDAAALAAASVGIAVRGSMEVSLRAADIYLMNAELTALPRLLDLARRTRRVIQRNLMFSGTFNFVAATLAIGGWMSPLLAAVLMPLSSLTVLLSALYSGRATQRREAA